MGRALARDPKLFLFDEPLSNLDAKLRVEMRAEIKLLHQRTQTTTVYVTHDQVEAMTLGDRIAVMKDGLVQQFGTPAQIYNHPANRFVAEFIGSPAMNMVDAQRVGAALTAHGVELPITDAQSAAVQAHGSAELVYGLRPESIGFAAQGLPGTLSMIEPTGPETYATVDTAAGKLTARVPGVLQASVGDAVHLQWSAESSHLFDRTSGNRVG
jgi:multiple sugar transport system ATP-binding protein